jgi:hypothetical protein
MRTICGWGHSTKCEHKAKLSLLLQPLLPKRAALNQRAFETSKTWV